MSGGIPLLRFLTLSSVTGLGSLSFLSAGSLPRTLESLSLEHFFPRFPTDELAALHALRAVQSIALVDVLEEELSEQQQARYAAPSALMPSLRTFSCS